MKVMGNAMIKIWSVHTLVLLYILSFGSGCSEKRQASDEIPSEVQAILNKLNDWDKQELDIVECPNLYPNHTLSGETQGWVTVHKSELKQLGFAAKWNREKMVYELQKIGQKECDGAVSENLQDIKKDPNAYYDGCVSCTLAIEKRGFLFKRIFVKATFKNETHYPIPVEKRHLEPGGFDVYRDGEVVPYTGAIASREPSIYPWEYYILPPHGTYVSLTNLSKHHDLSKKGKYKVQYLAFNSLTDVLKQPYLLRIESEPVEFEIK